MRADPRRVAVLAIVTLFVLINVGNALYKGGDFGVFLDAGHRILNATPLYEGSSPGSGVIGPPFHGVFFAPFAAIDSRSAVASALLWYVVNVAGLIAGIVLWSRALDPGGGNTFSKSATLWSMAAILLPAQTNFEHQNMSPLLLALTGAGALGVTRRAPWITGTALGVAIALKAFPALLVVPLVIKRSWRAVAIAAAVAGALTASVALAYGVDGGLVTVGRWLELAREPYWPTRMQSQSLFAMFSRISPDNGLAWSTTASALLVGALVIVCVRCRRLAGERAGAELALALAIAVLMSPIAWDHYWVLMFPAFRVVYAAHPAMFWSSAALVTGLSPLTIGRHYSNVLRSWSASTIAGILLVIGVIAVLERAQREQVD